MKNSREVAWCSGTRRNRGRRGVMRRISSQASGVLKRWRCHRRKERFGRGEVSLSTEGEGKGDLLDRNRVDAKS